MSACDRRHHSLITSPYYTVKDPKTSNYKMKSIAIILVSMMAACHCDTRRVVSSPRQQKGQLQEAADAENSVNPGEYFALTKDGTLQPIQLVFPQGYQVQMVASSAPFLLTPDGRLEKLTSGPEVTARPVGVAAADTVRYLRLTEDGRLEPIKKEDIPADAQEESGEYHVLLPTGALQRVRFMRTGTSAKVLFQQVDPISGPVYRYASPLVPAV